jgi:hypothetical protein
MEGIIPEIPHKGDNIQSSGKGLKIFNAGLHGMNGVQTEKFNK